MESPDCPKSARCWGGLQTLITLVVLLGGAVALLSWAEIHNGTTTTGMPALSSTVGRSIGLLRHTFGFASQDAAGSNGSSSSSSRGGSSLSPGPLLSVRMTGNQSTFGDAWASAGGMAATDSLSAAVSSMLQSGGAALPANRSTNDSAPSPGAAPPALDQQQLLTDVVVKLAQKIKELEAAVHDKQLNSSAGAQQVTAAAASNGSSTLVSSSGTAALVGSIPAGSASSSSSSSSGSSSNSRTTHSSCTCFRADPVRLRQQCSRKGQDWPAKNAGLVSSCMDYLAHNATDYLQVLEQHDPSNTASCSQQLLLHTFWSGPMTWKLKAVMQSFLYTHYTNDSSCRPKPVLNVWLQTVDPTRSQLERWAKEWDAPWFLHSDQLQFRRWDNSGWLEWLPPSMFSSPRNGTVNITAVHEAVAAGAAAGSRVSYSDAVRFLVLYKFGGIYTDGDVLLLRNMEPFSHYDFLHEWSFVKDGMNTAVFGARRGSPFLSATIQRALRSAIKTGAAGNVTFDPRSFNGFFHPLKVLQRLPPHIAAAVEVLPSIPFDPLWLTLDTPKVASHNISQIHTLRSYVDFFTKPPPYATLPQVATDIFRGAFAHHWHNNWHLPFVNSSAVGRLEQSYERFLQGKQPSAEGLMAPPFPGTAR